MSEPELPQPSWRKPAGAFVMIGEIVLLAWLVGNIATPLGRLPALLQLPIYLALGIVWILPLGPLLRWMETGKWR